MNAPSRPLLWLTLILLFAFGCKKNASDEVVYHFSNFGVRDAITIDLYGSLADYAANANRIYRYTLQPDGAIDVPLESGKTYWMDWYNPGYSLSNWHYNAIELHAGKDPTEYMIQSGFSDTSRSVILNGGGTFSHWEGTLVNTDSLFEGRDSLDGKYEISFFKDFSCVLTHHGKYATTKDTTWFNAQRIDTYSGAQKGIIVYAGGPGLAGLNMIQDYVDGSFGPPVNSRDTFRALFGYRKGGTRSSFFKIWRK